MTDYTGKKVIIRADQAGVFFGTLADYDKANAIVELHQCRRLWYWSGAASISQLANDGAKNVNDCKFTQVLESIQIAGVVEVVPCTEQAINNIEGVPVWEV